MMIEKYKEERIASQSRSQEKSYENYNPVNLEANQSTPTSYYANVKDPHNHSYLSRMGEVNREAIDKINSFREEKQYFNSRLSREVEDEQMRQLRDKYNNHLKQKLERNAS